MGGLVGWFPNPGYRGLARAASLRNLRWRGAGWVFPGDLAGWLRRGGSWGGRGLPRAERPGNRVTEHRQVLLARSRVRAGTGAAQTGRCAGQEASVLHARAGGCISTRCRARPNFQKLAEKSGEAIWGDAPTLCCAQGPAGPDVLLLRDLCTRAPAFGVPPPTVTGPVGETPHVCSHQKRGEAVGRGSALVAGWTLMVARDLRRRRGRVKWPEPLCGDAVRGSAQVVWHDLGVQPQ